MDIRNKMKTYIDLLKQFNEFNKGEDNKIYPAYSYMNKTDSQLVLLNESFNIDDRIKEMTEIESILHLLKWIYEVIPYDGGANYPANHDALSILNNPCPLNCWIKAMILNEVYLSAGFKSRILFCLPADFDGDNHVITMVYSQKYGKWLTVDPSHNTYFFSESGSILNIFEVRKIYSEGITPNIKHIEREMTNPLFCNGISYFSYDEFYQVYMAKNCFRFISPLASKYRYDANPNGIEYLILNPLYYDNARGAKYDNGIANKSKIHYTNNIDVFLQI